jgi:hypothetical protein
MKRLITLGLLINSLLSFGQIISGDDVEQGLKIAYNPANKVITGFYENYYGYDESGKPNHRYSCILYFKGVYMDTVSDLESYQSLIKENIKIPGKIKISDSLHISIILNEEPNCFNVAMFSQAYVPFELTIKTNWIEIRYIDADKSYFYANTDENSRRKAYLLKGDIIYIDQIENDWVHCRFYGKTITEGWIKKETINK